MDTWSCRAKYRWILGRVVQNTDGYLVVSIVSIDVHNLHAGGRQTEVTDLGAKIMVSRRSWLFFSRKRGSIQVNLLKFLAFRTARRARWPAWSTGMMKARIFSQLCRLSHLGVSSWTESLDACFHQMPMKRVRCVRTANFGSSPCKHFILFRIV